MGGIDPKKGEGPGSRSEPSPPRQEPVLKGGGNVWTHCTLCWKFNNTGPFVIQNLSLALGHVGRNAYVLASS